MSIVYPEFLPERAPKAPSAVSPPSASSTNSPRGPYRRALKRLLDVSLVVMAAPVVVPVIAVLAMAIRRDGAGAFYTQPRIGKDGRTFRLWKLRTMVPDAEARLQHLLDNDPVARAEWETTQKLRRDPRVTPTGQFLRQSSLDELPQLWNVLKGEMSLVGPRPMMPDQQILYPGTAYYSLRPGITGLWQTDGRNATTFAARAEYDARYEAKVSMATDLRILLRTVGVVLRRTGC